MVTRRPYKDLLGKVLCEAGIVRESKMKRRRRGGKLARRGPDGSTVG